MLRLLILVTVFFVIAGCQRAHLQIFPELDEPALMERKLSVAQMRQDVDALLHGVLVRHPQIERYADMNILNQAVEDMKLKLTQPLTRVEFFRVVGQMNHLFGDGHSFLIWPYQEYNVLKKAGKTPFPFDVVFTQKNELRLKHRYQNNTVTLAESSQISAINGVPTAELFHRMQQFVGGETLLLRQQIVAERFAVMLWAVYGFIDNFEVEFAGQKDVNSIHVTSNSQWKQLQQNDLTSDHQYQRLSQHTGYLYLAHFDLDPSDFEDFIDDTFATIRQQKIKHLIIDIRDNPGGNTDTVTYLTRHLADKPFRLVSNLKEKLNPDNRGWLNYRGEIGEILEQEWDDWEQPISSENRFVGDTYLLIGPITYSAAIVLSTTLKDNNFATLVGTKTGGYANQSAQGNLFNLPNSKLRAYITTRLLVRPNGDETRTAVTPHHVIEQGWSVLNAEDSALEKVKRLINLRKAP